MKFPKQLKIAKKCGEHLWERGYFHAAWPMSRGLSVYVWVSVVYAC